MYDASGCRRGVNVFVPVFKPKKNPVKDPTQLVPSCLKPSDEQHQKRQVRFQNHFAKLCHHQQATPCPRRDLESVPAFKMSHRCDCAWMLAASSMCHANVAPHIESHGVVAFCGGGLTNAQIDPRAPVWPTHASISSSFGHRGAMTSL